MSPASSPAQTIHSVANGHRRDRANSSRSAGSVASVPRSLLRAALLASTYYVIGEASLRLALVRGQVTPIWPPTGIALVGLLLFGRRSWPGITVGAFLVNAPIGPSLPAAAAIAIGNTLAPLAAITLLEAVGFEKELDRLRDAIGLVFLAAILSMAVSATVGTATLVLSGAVPARAFWPTWLVWWAGDAMGILIVAPFLLSLLRVRVHTALPWRRRAEEILLFSGTLVVAGAVFGTRLRITYLIFPFLAYAAWRFGQRMAATSALLVSGIAIVAAVHRVGPFASETLALRMINLQVFNASVALATLVLTSAVAERRKDVAARLRAEQQLAHQALHDPLTGLPNRALFMDRLEQAVARSERRSHPVAVMFLDLDRFKVINDSLGHTAGDQVLIRVGQRLRASLRPGDTVCRFGGDEFVVLCEDMRSEGEATHIATRLGWSVAHPIPLPTGEVVVTTSIGVAIAKGPQDSAENLVRDADAALYRAKERGRARHELFDHRMRSRAVMRLQTESELRQAIGARAFEAHYQPIVRLADGHPVAMEALLRWKHPDRGLLPPADFIPVAEETGLIVPLGAWVMQEACRQGSRWQGAPRAAPLAVSVNVSPRQIAQPAFADEVRAALASADLQPTSLWLEITESVLVDATSITLRVLDRLRGLGVRLAIDDFGTGYSSLGYLRRFDVDMLKIDRSFVSVLGRDAEDSAIVAAIISLARALGLSVVAEGVETPEQAEHLRALGCDLAQGYHFAHPQPADAWSSSVLAANARRFPERPRPWRLQAPGT